ncbi:MAG TPA: transposase [Thiothrix sp.]|nr:transposase [Thiothrix sp.]
MIDAFISKQSAVKTSLFAAEEREEKLNRQGVNRQGDSLLTLNELIDFARLADNLDKVAPRPFSTKGGRPPYPTELMTRELMTRLLVLQHLYHLSDDAVEYQLLDRLSFQAL